MLPFAISVEEYNIIREWCVECNATVSVKVDNFKREITIYTDKPGYMIGPRGSTVEKYESFEDFVDTLRSIVLSPDSNISSVFFDKENMNEDVETSYPELELFHEAEDWVVIRRIRHFRKSKDEVVWEIFLDDDNAEQLLDELETWLDDEEDEDD